MARRFLSAIKLLTGSTPPAGTAGDTFFDTDTKTIQVHDGDAWVNSAVQATDGAIGGRVFTGDAAPSAPVAGDLWVDSTGFSSGANILRWRITAVGGETSFSGLDDLSTTLSYTPGYEQVYINGVLQVRGQDYVATTGTTITGLTALAAADVVEVLAHSNMVYGDYYTQSQADARYYTKTQGDARYYPDRNLLCNGKAEVVQRGALPYQGFNQNLFPSEGYTADRWFGRAHSTTGYPNTSTFGVVDNVSPTNDVREFKNKFLLENYGASTGINTYSFISQALETVDSRRLAGKTVILSFWTQWALSSPSSSNFNFTAHIVSGTGTDQKANGFTGFTSVASTTVAFSWGGNPLNFSNGWQKITITGTVPTTSTQVGIYFELQNNLASSSDNAWVNIAGVQLELGSVATPFEHIPYQQELARCQRYYEKSYNQSVVPGAVSEPGGFFAWGSTQSDGFIGTTVNFKVPKRNSTYTFVGYSPSSGTVGSFDVLRAGSTTVIAIAGTLAKGENSISPYVQSGANNALARVFGQWTADAEF